ncbi:MocR-like pyridoxine biosynthesis transcription factor PdxR [Catelliglobosispora koreensis]|uniref:MocR-like pyridoxine biosynthesis transcription factor PdxR n=1 Tax=Catelliglobosispora koreensis TaxID=129052 RepID=UPI000376C3C5|nr:PLP-dependent aminotransferase family protein [Catelliglobosispora koreensis]
MQFDWANSGVDLHLELAVGGRRAGLETALREAIRDGRLSPGTRLPSTRDLARELGLARNTVSAAYEQLTAEGFLAARTGSGTVVAELPSAGPLAEPSSPVDDTFLYDLGAGTPDVTTFPTAAWLRSMRRALAVAPAHTYGYGPEAGALELRLALTEYLGRSRGVLASPDRIVITTGYVQALSLLARVVDGPIAMEDPGLSFHRDVVAFTGRPVLPLSVDSLGATAPPAKAKAVVVTPAHQYPMGVTLHPQRRRMLAEWARSTGGLIIEDDYDGEFRYDRQPVGALQGAAPDHTVYLGTAAKTLAPALRLAWMILPPALVEPVKAAKRLSDGHSEVLGQLALADLIATHAFDRHVRACRQHYRKRRDLLAERLASHRVQGISAGLHALIALPDNVSEADVIAAAAKRGLRLAGLGPHWHGTPRSAGIVAGYGTPPERLWPGALNTLSLVLRGV